MKCAKNETKITKEKKYLSYLKRMGTGKCQWLVHTTGPGAGWRPGWGREAACISEFLSHRSFAHHHLPHLPEPEHPALDRNNSGEKYPRRRLSLVQTFSWAKKVDWATHTPGWVVVGLQSRREKMKVSKPCPSQWVGESVFVFPGRFAWGKALKPWTIKCSGISPIWTKLVNFYHRCNCGRLDLPSTWPDSHSTSHPLATAAPFLSWRGSPSSGENCSTVCRYGDGVGEGSLGTYEIMTWNHPWSRRRELESRDRWETTKQKGLGEEVEMEMVPMNSSHETEGRFLKDSKLGHDRTLSTF